jgi:type IV pilus assembly protein PilA
VKQQGFTLIELMMVVAIIGILAAIAIPQYQSYTVRTKVSEAVVQLGSIKTTITEYYQSQGSMPVTAASAGIAQTISSKYVSALSYTRNDVDQATIAAVMTGRLGSGIDSGQTVVIVGSGSPGRVTWDCRPGTLPAKYLPSQCRD